MALISANVNVLSAFRYPPPPPGGRDASGGKRKVVDVWREVCTLIYPDPYYTKLEGLNLAATAGGK